ncbi:unnamed protein product [Nyctereutes procyonoides]|uniref:(raccoon dog) hypothetical protein n=1 Tax=Nyctereutes procyonoides TaxID=34880 RepID=A0A811XVI9_NYCPR|nr:unnamed protein product [Nyctereutes procyonoides]
MEGGAGAPVPQSPTMVAALASQYESALLQKKGVPILGLVLLGTTMATKESRGQVEHPPSAQVMISGS